MTALVVLSLTAAPAAAAYLSGTLASDYNLVYGSSAPNPLATAALGGSFSGTFSTDGLPLLTIGGEVDLTAFDISVFDTFGNTVVNYSNANANDVAAVQTYNYLGVDYNTLNFEHDSGVLGSQTSALQFAFPFGFVGAGTADVAIEGFYASYSSGTDGQGNANPLGPFTRIREVSATSVVPEPTSLSLLAFGCLILLTRRRRSVS